MANIEHESHAFSHIKGWGIDADPENDPTYPMKKRTNAEHRGYVWDRPHRQRADVEILQSNERPNLTAVFGTATPPAGLRGAIRRWAFRHSESSYRHWVPLLLADRVNMLEGLVDDACQGRVPNLFREMGYGADLRYDRKRFVTKCAAVGMLATAAFACLHRRRSR